MCFLDKLHFSYLQQFSAFVMMREGLKAVFCLLRSSARMCFSSPLHPSACPHTDTNLYFLSSLFHHYEDKVKDGDRVQDLRLS